jgi:hypothetical protein
MFSFDSKIAQASRPSRESTSWRPTITGRNLATTAAQRAMS